LTGAEALRQSATTLAAFFSTIMSLVSEHPWSKPRKNWTLADETGFSTEASFPESEAEGDVADALAAAVVAAAVVTAEEEEDNEDEEEEEALSFALIDEASNFAK